MQLTYTLRRGASGLGIDVGPGHVIVEIVAAGQAEADGVARVGDVIEAVDGVALTASRGMVNVMVRGRASYEMVVRRPEPGALETQALASGLLGSDTQGKRPPVRLVSARVRRGPNGLGLDLGHFNRVQSIVEGSPAAEDLTVLPGDIVAAVDNQLVGCGSLPPLLTPGKQRYVFLLMRADAQAALSPPPASKPSPQPVTPKPRPLTNAELALVMDTSPKGTSPKPMETVSYLKATAAGPLADGGTQSSQKEVQAAPGSSAERKPTWTFQLKEEDEEEEEEEEEEKGGGDASVRSVTALAIAEEEDEETDEEEDPSANDVNPEALDVLWDVMTCPLAKALVSPGESDQASSALITGLQRLRLRVQTACARGASLGNVVAYGEFGSLVDSPLAKALVACGIHVVACAAPDTCPRGGVACALLSAMSLRALDHRASGMLPGSQPLFVASARPGVQQAVQELNARGFEIYLSAPVDSLKIIQPRGGPQRMLARTLRVYGWPHLYPVSPDELVGKGASSKPQKANSLPGWLSK